MGLRSSNSDCQVVELSEATLNHHNDFTGDLIRACNLNPTLNTIKEIGGTTEKGQKMLTKDQVFPIYKAAKDSKDQGGFHDFVEILKLYDKNDDNTMLSHELF